ncbi:hypothetical protein LCGC14_2876200 [marine sediment metagenome]|uniref:Uncharacterized protein n=1 Tax=marine sediment metagenome TaxID=412755 RepID=A0A0F8Y1E3_9ZZZZ
MSPDLLVASGQAALAVLVLLLLFSRSPHIHRIISALTTLALTAVSIGLIGLSAPMSASFAAICAAGGLGIFAIRGTLHGLR